MHVLSLDLIYKIEEMCTVLNQQHHWNSQDFYSLHFYERSVRDRNPASSEN